MVAIYFLCIYDFFTVFLLTHFLFLIGTGAWWGFHGQRTWLRRKKMIFENAAESEIDVFCCFTFLNSLPVFFVFLFFVFLDWFLECSWNISEIDPDAIERLFRKNFDFGKKEWNKMLTELKKNKINYGAVPKNQKIYF